MIIGDDIVKASEIILNGGLVAFPTETVYGLGANAFNSLACARIFEEKKRPTFDPLIVHIYKIDQIFQLFETPIPDIIFELGLAFWPGPLTLVFKKNKNVPDIITAGLSTVGVRMPSNATARKLLELTNVPIAAPSANKFGSISPTKPEHVIKQNFNIDYLLLGENPTKGIESTILYIDNEDIFLLRPGAITLEDISKICKVNISNHNVAQNQDLILSPGTLKSHYSPSKPTYLFSKDILNIPPNSGLIAHKRIDFDNRFAKIIYTSTNENFLEIAANLFERMHTFDDDPNIQNIFIMPVKAEGLGLAIMDRIKKACAKYQNN